LRRKNKCRRKQRGGQNVTPHNDPPEGLFSPAQNARHATMLS
jgi:hypothetical protein